jgi:hypothetical protein
MFKKIISNRRVVTIAVSVLALFAITMALRQVGLYEGMKNKEGMEDKKEGMEDKKEGMKGKKEGMEDKKEAAEDEKKEEEKKTEVKPAEELSSMKSTKVAKAFVQE